ncbi:MAG TPA: DUF3387 domain-containing protein, partial [Saprospiraceae bacterium]|nr:DUF3387 domain-containing protein [Saprospiraceae bacterium]
TRFKDENDPFRFVIVCAMWITGFDVPTLSTLYLDKPLKSHTLMQAIARANRISEGKNNGLIVDYIETYVALLDALAIYGAGDAKGDTEGNQPTEPPVRPLEDLIHELDQALIATESYLKLDLKFDLAELIDSTGLDKILAIEKGINAVYTNDESKSKFQLLAREVFNKFKALQPDKVLNQFAPRRNAINAIYSAIEDNIQSADVTEIMKKIQAIVDDSISSVAAEPGKDNGKIIDLSKLNVEILVKHFEKSGNKNSIVQAIKTKVEQQLRDMVDKNPLRVDFYTRYQEIIDEYNRGKDAVTIEETFKKLIEFVNSLTEEEADTRREGLTDEQKAIFDILRKPSLSDSDKKKVKEIAIELLTELKKDKLKVEQWSDKLETAAAVFNTVSNTLFNSMPYPTYQIDDLELKTNLVYQHLKQRYYGGGQSIYGNY